MCLTPLPKHKLHALRASCRYAQLSASAFVMKRSGGTADDGAAGAKRRKGQQPVRADPADADVKTVSEAEEASPVHHEQCSQISVLSRAWSLS